MISQKEVRWNDELSRFNVVVSKVETSWTGQRKSFVRLSLDHFKDGTDYFILRHFDKRAISTYLDHCKVAALLADHEMIWAQTTDAEYVALKAALTYNIEVIGCIDEVKLVCRTYEDLLPVFKRALHLFDSERFIDMWLAVLNNINFASWVPNDDILLMIVAVWCIHEGKMHFLPETMILEDCLWRWLIEVCLDQLLDLMMDQSVDLSVLRVGRLGIYRLIRILTIALV